MPTDQQSVPSLRAELRDGVKVSLPITMGYFAVAIAIGIYWSQGKLPPLGSVIYSATTFSSTGQYAGIALLIAQAGLAELAATTALINLRYSLMSLSLSQKLSATSPRPVGTWKRLVMAAGVTDEIYAVNITRPQLTFAHFFASMIPPLLGWTAGTLTGVYVGRGLPPAILSATGILIFALFVAIVMPAFKASVRVRLVVAISVGVSLALGFVPAFAGLSTGWRIIIATLIAAGVGATFFPETEGEVSGEAPSNSARRKPNTNPSPEPRPGKTEAKTKNPNPEPRPDESTQEAQR